MLRTTLFLAGVVGAAAAGQPNQLPQHATSSVLDDEDAGTCDFRLVEEQKLSAWIDDLKKIGVRGDNSLCIAGYAMTNWHCRDPDPTALCHNSTFDLTKFCTTTRQELLGFVRTHVLPALHNDTQWRGLLTMDLENQVRPDFFHAFSDAKLEAVVTAMKLRVSVLREVFPNAGVSMYMSPPRYENVRSRHLYWSRDNGRKVPYGLDYSVVVPNTRLFRL